MNGKVTTPSAAGMTTTAAGLKTRLKVWQARRRAIADLNVLDDRLLADIGMYRGMSPEFIEQMLPGATAAANDNRGQIAA
jgi:uncharacterized protein YjiS (DUF1127 family)